MTEIRTPETSHPHQTWLITGGAGFIGSHLVRACVADPTLSVINYDALTYAGRRENLADLEDHPRYAFVHGDVCDGLTVRRTLAEHRPDVVLHLAAESHVDRSIDGPAEFVQTNVVGTSTLLDAVRDYLAELPADRRARFRLVHVSTDEVYGSAAPDDPPFTEHAPYAPSSPYAASKAAADHLVRAAHITYGVPAIITCASNNFGPYQFPEKLIPVIVDCALAGDAIPIYGDGGNVRDWLAVGDHCAALRLIARRGRPGARYNIGGGNERTNLALARAICAAIDEHTPDLAPTARHLRFVADRPGHDRRYAIDASRLRRELGWTPTDDFDAALRETVAWYVNNRDWRARIAAGGHRRARLGLGRPARRDDRDDGREGIASAT